MKQLIVSARDSELGTILRFIEDELSAHDCPLKARMQLTLAAEEVFVNIARYAFSGEDGEVALSVSISSNPPLATLAFSDGGVPYNPLERPDPDVSLSAAEREIGGLGIYMVKRNVDEVRYRHENGRNVLTLIKTLR